MYIAAVKCMNMVNYIKAIQVAPKHSRLGLFANKFRLGRVLVTKDLERILELQIRNCELYKHFRTCVLSLLNPVGHCVTP